MATPITLIVKPRGKPISRLPSDISVDLKSPLSTLYDTISAETKYSPHRLRLSKGSDGSLLPNVTGRSVSSTSLRNNSTIVVKDLGPQISWRTVFVVEYLGPLILHPLWLYLLRPYLLSPPGPPPPPPSESQTLFMALCTLHFVKRELETLFVHRFSLATMPAFNILKNSGHYWLLSGVNMAYWVYGPTSPTASITPASAPILTTAGLAAYVLGEVGNGLTHLALRSLRSEGGTERGIPHGVGFDLVTCPNYMFETVAWVGLWLISGLSWSVLVFIVAADAQMAAWAKKKERRYRSEFGDKYQKKRFVMIPGLV